MARRNAHQDSFIKRYIVWIFYRLLIIVGVSAESRGARDFRLITKRAQDLILAQANSLQYIRGQIFTHKTPVYVININGRGRVARTIKYTLSKMKRLAISSVFFVDPLKISQIYIGAASFLQPCLSH